MSDENETPPPQDPSASETPPPPDEEIIEQKPAGPSEEEVLREILAMKNETVRTQILADFLLKARGGKPESEVKSTSEPTGKPAVTTVDPIVQSANAKPAYHPPATGAARNGGRSIFLIKTNEGGVK